MKPSENQVVSIPSNVQMIERSCAINHNLHWSRDYWQSTDYITDNNITYTKPQRSIVVISAYVQ